MILHVVWSANGDLTSKASSKVNSLNDDTYQWDCATVIYYVILRTSRARCTLNKDILDLLNEESVSGACNGNSTRSLLQVFDKVNRPLKCHSNFLGGYIYYSVWEDQRKNRLCIQHMNL